jgi:5'-methylthioadenosine phosphorylase
MLGVLGGSGLYQMPGLQVVEERAVETPFGLPSDHLVIGAIDGHRVAFLPRHGRGHRLSPSEINYRANIYALKQVGCDSVLSVSAVGSLREHAHPGEMVCVDQFVDRTRSRVGTFFGRGVVAHVAMADPVCPALRTRVLAAAAVKTHETGTYVCIEGPQFSTKAESQEFRALGGTVIGMTNAPEYKLAREAQLCYATLALVTDYDCWYEGHEVSLPEILKIMHQNVEHAQTVIRGVVASAAERTCACGSASKHAVITEASVIPDAEKALIAFLQR